MKNFFLVFLLLLPTTLMARGLRYSVCQVAPEYTAAEQKQMSEVSLALSRLGRQGEMQRAQMIHRSGYYGSGVVVRMDGLYVLTTRDVIGYAASATITVYLHDKTLSFRGCSVVGTDTVSGVALVSVPESDDLEPLVLAELPIEDGDDISVAGFSSLNKQAAWQLLRGSVSNAFLHREGRSYIQHTAPLNPGMLGGPLLHRSDSGYVLVGLSLGSMNGREDVALAIPVSDLRHALTSHSLCSGQDMLHNDRLAITKSASKQDDVAFRDIERGLTSGISRFKQSVFYHNYLSADNQEVGISMEFALGKRKLSFLGMQFSSSWTEARPMSKHPTSYGYYFTRYYDLYDPRPVFSPLFGLYLGVQVPLRVGTHHVLVPRLSQGGNIGPCVNRYDAKTDKRSVGAPLITSDSRLGLEYHYQMSRVALIVALEYTAHIFATEADVCWTYQNNAKPVEPIDKHTKLLYINEDHDNVRYNCFNHGLGVRLAVGF